MEADAMWSVLNLLHRNSLAFTSTSYINSMGMIEHRVCKRKRNVHLADSLGFATSVDSADRRRYLLQAEGGRKRIKISSADSGDDLDHSERIVDVSHVDLNVADNKPLEKHRNETIPNIEIVERNLPLEHICTMAAHDALVYLVLSDDSVRCSFTSVFVPYFQVAHSFRLSDSDMLPRNVYHSCINHKSARTVAKILKDSEIASRTAC